MTAPAAVWLAVIVLPFAAHSADATSLQSMRGTPLVAWVAIFQQSTMMLVTVIAMVLMLRYFCIARKLKEETHRMVGELALHKEREKQARNLLKAVECSSTSIVISDRQGRIEYVNPKFCSLTGYTFEEVRGQNPRLLKSGEMHPEVFQDLWKVILSGQEWHGEFHNRKKNGELYWELASISPIFNEAGEVTHFVSMKEDITERKRMEQAIREKKAELRESNRKLEQSLAEVKELSGLLPICAWCNKIRDETEYWLRVEDYISQRTKAHFTHGICPDCSKRALEAIR